MWTSAQTILLHGSPSLWRFSSCCRLIVCVGRGTMFSASCILLFGIIKSRSNSNTCGYTSCLVHHHKSYCFRFFLFLALERRAHYVQKRCCCGSPGPRSNFKDYSIINTDHHVQQFTISSRVAPSGGCLDLTTLIFTFYGVTSANFRYFLCSSK